MGRDSNPGPNPPLYLLKRTQPSRLRCVWQRHCRGTTMDLLTEVRSWVGCLLGSSEGQSHAPFPNHDRCGGRDRDLTLPWIPWLPVCITYLLDYGACGLAFLFIRLHESATAWLSDAQCPVLQSQQHLALAVNKQDDKCTLLSNHNRSRQLVHELKTPEPSISCGSTSAAGLGFAPWYYAKLPFLRKGATVSVTARGQPVHRGDRYGVSRSCIE